MFSLGDKDVLIVSPIGFEADDFRFTNVNSSVWFIGKVDWETGQFVTESVEEIDGGLDFYAPQTLLDDKNRRIMIAWEQMWGRNIPTDDLGHLWAGSMTIPKVLNLQDGIMKQDYISEFYDLFKEVTHYDHQTHFETELVPLLTGEFNQEFTIKIGTKDEYVKITYLDQLLTFDRSQIGNKIKDSANDKSIRQCRIPCDKIKLTLVVDVSSIELIINNEYVFSNTYYPKSENGKIQIQSESFQVSIYK